jgi:hypothetical protein
MTQIQTYRERIRGADDHLSVLCQIANLSILCASDGNVQDVKGTTHCYSELWGSKKLIVSDEYLITKRSERSTIPIHTRSPAKLATSER